MADDMPDDFADWVTAHQSRLLRAAYAITGDPALADDLVQDALVKLAKKWHRLRDEQAFAYTRTIIYRDHATWWRRRRDIPTDTVAETRDVPTDPHGPTDVRLSLHEALAHLTPKQRAVVALRYLEDLSERQTAEVLGVSVGTVKSQTSVGLAKLRGYPGLEALLGEGAPS